MNAKQSLVTLSAFLFVANVAANDSDNSFKQLDTDHNGFISKIEASTDKVLSKVFNKLDTNNDEVLSKKEFSELHRHIIEK